MLRGLAQCQLQCLQDCRCVLLAPRPAACRSLLVQAAAARRAGCSWQGSPCLAPPRLQPCAPTLQRVHSTSSTVEAVTTAKKGKLCLIDGHNLAYRAFYGIFKAPMTELKTKDGIPTTVTFGFVRTLLALLEQEQPDALVVVFDAPGGATFRRELLSDYKATRSKPPPEFAVDLTNLQLLLQFTRIPTLSVPGFEADDVMAGLAAQAKAAGWRTLLVSTDKDLWQVVDDAGGVSVLPPSGSSSKSGGKTSGVGHYITESAVQESLGVPPQRLPDFKALSGDSSDNIKGVPGIGPKTASQLLQKHGDLESVFLHAEGEKKGVAAKLAGQQAAAALFKDLATVRPEAAPAFDFEAARLQGCAAAELEPLLSRLEMNSLVKDMHRLQRLMGGVATPDPTRTAALPAALKCLAGAAALMTSGYDEEEFRMKHKQLAAAAAAVVTASPEGASAHGLGPLSVTDTSNSSAISSSSRSGAALSSAAGSGEGVMSASSPGAHVQQPDALAAVPAVKLITTQQDLQALVRELQQQPQAVVSWSWPQDTPYSPGNRQQAPPQVLCCAWQPTLPPSSSSGDPGSSSSSKADPPAAAPAAAAAAAAAPRRRRRTRAATTMQQQQLVLQQSQQAPAVQPVLQPAVAPAVSGGCGLAVAVVVSCAGLSPDVLLSTCRPLLESGDHAKVIFESKRAYTELRHLGIQLAGVSYDVLVAGCLPDPKRWAEVLDPQQQQTAVLPAMTQHVLHTNLTDMAAALQVAAPGDTAGPLAGGSSSRVVWQAAAGAWANLLLRDSFSASMQGLSEGAQLQALLQGIELPLQAVLSDMEVTGVRCDKQLLLEQKVQLQAEVTALEQQLFSIAGRPFNLNSPKECSAVIFEELGLKGKAIKRTKSGYFSTSMSEIDKLEASPFKAAFTEWSRLSSLLTKFYGDTYLGAINTHTGRIHTTYQQVGIATGRLASSNPNMQAVPAHDERGRLFKAAFTADDGHLLVAADYSQVELRVMAALSGDEALLQAFAAGQDVHAATARDVLGKGPQDTITPEERQLGKRVNFSIVYGAGKRQVAAELGLGQKEAGAILDNFKAAHPKMLDYKTHCMRQAVSRGHTHSAAGRRRCYTFTSPGLAGLRGVQDLSQLPDMQGLQKLAGRDDAHVLLAASNAPIQGTSADLLKAALIQLHQQLTGPPYCCRLMLTAHDDVLLEVPAEHWPKLQRVVERAMEEALPGYGLMLKADVAAGASWLECK